MLYRAPVPTGAADDMNWLAPWLTPRDKFPSRDWVAALPSSLAACPIGWLMELAPVLIACCSKELVAIGWLKELACCIAGSPQELVWPRLELVIGWAKVLPWPVWENEVAWPRLELAIGCAKLLAVCPARSLYQE